MLQASVVIFVALAYIGLLFAIASYGDRLRPGAGRGTARPMIYSLSLAVYCTSWTFFGSVGLATTQGFDFLTIYLGPIILMTVGAPLFLRVVRLAKANNITSIADFIAARYGKNQGIAALVAIVAIIAAVPALKPHRAEVAAMGDRFAARHACVRHILHVRRPRPRCHRDRSGGRVSERGLSPDRPPRHLDRQAHNMVR